MRASAFLQCIFNSAHPSLFDYFDSNRFSVGNYRR